ncbi:MAG: hypothetical protein WDM89_19515 [Rhizomicrobium sp.]
MVHVAPDAIFGLRIEREGMSALASYYFLEIDRGTMTIIPSEQVRESEAFPYRATILRKLYAYASSHRLGLQERQFGIKAARVLLLTNSSSRADAMRHAAEHLLKEGLFPAGLFQFGSSLSATGSLMAGIVGI